MLKREKVYICDFCGKVALPVKRFNYGLGIRYFSMPDEWIDRGKFDLCPECDEVYLKLKNMKGTKEQES